MGSKPSLTRFSASAALRTLALCLVLPHAVAALDAPQVQLEARAAGDSVDARLNWSPVAGAHHYRVASQSASGLFRWVDTVDSLAFPQRVPGGSWRWRVSAVSQAEEAPLAAAPQPGHAATQVLALFSEAYNCLPVDTWSAPWDQAELQEQLVQGNAVKRYSQLGFAAAEFSSHPIDARQMTHLRVDLWVPEGSSSFRVKLVDFGANAVYGGGDDSEHEVAVTPLSSPGLVTGHWQRLDLPLAMFSGLRARAHLCQLLFSGSASALFVDNIYLRRDEAWASPTQPLLPAPGPTHQAATVLSLFSGAYTNLPVDTWSAPWDLADQSFLSVTGDSVLRYTNLVYAGIECLGQPVDAGSMTALHLDVWTPDNTAAPVQLRVKLVDFGANGVWDGGGDDVEHEVAIDANGNPPLQSGAWLGLDLPLSAFTGLSTRRHLAQIIFSGGLSTLFVDNLYFHNSCAEWSSPSPPLPLRTEVETDTTLWSLVWQDEFDGPAGQPPDDANWTHDLGTGWGNAQLEYDTDRTSNSCLDGGGHLAITARRENVQGCAYSSARLVSRDRVEPTYGRVEARLRAPFGQGIWPAFWLLGANIDEAPWPACGEVDIMEMQGQQPDLNLGSLHGPGYSGGASYTHHYRLPGAGFHEDFHVFGVDWSPGMIVWSVDHQPFASATPADVAGAWVFDHPFYLIMNVAVGGSFVGNPDECTIFPQSMLVDWVRVYQARPGAATGRPAPVAQEHIHRISRPGPLTR